MLKRLSILGAFLLVVLLITLQFFGSPPHPSIFTPLDFDKAQALAAGGDGAPPKLLLVVFDSDDCPPCRELDKKVWTNSEVADWVRRETVAIKIAHDSDKGRARALGVQTIPCTLLLKGKSVLTKIDGPIPARVMLDRLKAAAADQPGAAHPPAASAPAPTGAPTP
jgi:thioredoxin-related protein